MVNFSKNAKAGQIEQLYKAQMRWQIIQNIRFHTKSQRGPILWMKQLCYVCWYKSCSSSPFSVRENNFWLRHLGGFSLNLGFSIDRFADLSQSSFIPVITCSKINYNIYQKYCIWQTVKHNPSCWKIIIEERYGNWSNEIVDTKFFTSKETGEKGSDF